MKRHSLNAKQGIALLAVLITGGLLAPGAFAQGQDGPPPPGGNDGPPPPMDGQGGPPMRRGMGGPGMRPISEATVPVSVLATGLNLSADQKAKITQIQQDVQKERRSLMAPPPGEGNDGPPDPETMRANRQKMRDLDDKVKTQIEAILTADQKQSLPGLMKTLQALQAAGIPPVLYGDLKLTADQKTKIAALAPAVPNGGRGGPQDGGGPGQGFGGPGQGGPGRGMGGPGGPNPKTREQVMAVLTDDQKSTVKDFQKTHPMMQRPGGPGGRGQGGPGGFGGPGGGPDGGPGGPPPGGNGDGPPPPPPGDPS